MMRGNLQNMASKFDKHCDFCSCIVENKKGIVKDFTTRSFGDARSSRRLRVCSDCDRKAKEMYKQ